MSKGNTSLTIISTAIRQDAEGRYCLNDCHKASGGEASKRPGVWMDNAQTKALIAELTDAGIPASPVSSVKGGTNQGTFVVKELVYAYAMWINPKFHIQVIQAFDAMVQGEAPAAPTIPQTYAQALLAAAQAEQERERLAEENAELRPKAEALHELASLDGWHNLRDSAKQCGWTERAFVARLMELGWIYAAPVTGRKCVKAEAIRAGFMTVKNVPIQRSSGITEGVGQPMINQEGLSRLKIILGVQPGKVSSRPFPHPKEAAS